MSTTEWSLHSDGTAVLSSLKHLHFASSKTDECPSRAVSRVRGHRTVNPHELGGTPVSLLSGRIHASFTATVRNRHRPLVCSRSVTSSTQEEVGRDRERAVRAVENDSERKGPERYITTCLATTTARALLDGCRASTSERRVRRMSSTGPDDRRSRIDDARLAWRAVYSQSTYLPSVVVLWPAVEQPRVRSRYPVRFVSVDRTRLPRPRILFSSSTIERLVGTAVSNGTLRASPTPIFDSDVGPLHHREEASEDRPISLTRLDERSSRHWTPRRSVSVLRRREPAIRDRVRPRTIHSWTRFRVREPLVARE